MLSSYMPGGLYGQDIIISLSLIHLHSGAFIPMYQLCGCAMDNFRGIFVELKIVIFGKYKHFLFHLCRKCFSGLNGASMQDFPFTILQF